MTFSATGLPEGLSLDGASGRITGSVNHAGEFDVKLTATNSLGSDTKNLHVIIGDKIALTPPMGWNSWNCWAWTVSQEKVLKSARAMAASGLANHGWTYINIDDSWQGTRGGEFNALQGNERFPDMKGLCDQIHGMGLKAGIYSTPWLGSYAMFQGGSSSRPDGGWTPPPANNRFPNPDPNKTFGKYPFASNDAKQWAAWGFDYLKYDWNPIDVAHTKEMSDALIDSGRDFVFSLSNGAPFNRAKDWTELSNAWRTTGDIRDTWYSIASIGFAQARWAPFGGPGHWNDPDMLVVGWVGWGPQLHSTQLNADEQYTHISLWCLLSAPMLIGCDLDRLDAFTLNLLTNDEVLAIDQDAGGKEAVKVAEQGETITIANPRGRRRAGGGGGGGRGLQYVPGQVWAKELADGSQAVGLFNLGNQEMTVTADFSALKLSGKQVVRDLWRQKDLGTFEGKFEATVEPHGVVLVKISPAS